jgi:hypothetical protein
MSDTANDEVPLARGRLFSPLRAGRFLLAIAMPVMLIVGTKPRMASYLGTKPFGVFGLVPLLIGLGSLVALMGMACWGQATSYAEPGKPYYTERTNNIYRFSYMGVVESDVRNKVVMLIAGPVGIITAAITLKGAGQVFVALGFFFFTLVLTIMIYSWAAHYAGYLKSGPVEVPSATL